MAKLLTYFDSWAKGSEPLNEKQLLALKVVAQLDQARMISNKILEEVMDDRKHPDRKRLRKLKRERLFKYMLDIHDSIGGKVNMSLPYVMLISSLSESKRDVLLFHAYTVFFARKTGNYFIDVDFWAMEAFQGGLLKRKDWRNQWKDQLEDIADSNEPMLESEEYWKELHAHFDEQLTELQAKAKDVLDEARETLNSKKNEA
ncbi:MAG: hypothetical protein P8J32_09225 [bacterium]|nr:hypothetical protein [bacterium]